MGTIANKINKVKNTKDKIKTITNLSTLNAITSETIFKDYPKQILKEYVKIINNGTNELYTNFPKVEDEGTELNLNTEEAPIKIILEGSTSQNTTIGKNLCNLSEGFRKGYLNSAGEFHAENVSFVLNQYIEVTEEETYTYSVNTQCINLTIYTFDENKNFIRSSTSWSVSSKTITLNEDEKYVVLGGNYNSKSIITQTILNNLEIQFELGNKTTYEPYAGGTISPNPNYPQSIKVVTGEQNVTIQNRNLLDTSESNTTLYAYFNSTNGNVVNDGTKTNCIFNEYIKVKPNTSYTMSSDEITSSSIYTYVEYDKNKNFLKYYSTGSLSKKVLTFITGLNTAYIRIRYKWSTGVTITNEIIENNKIQLENGSTTTPHVSYQLQTYPLSLGNIELAKINDYKDYMFKNEITSPYYNSELDLNEWYLHKEINKVIFNGSESSWKWKENDGAYFDGMSHYGKSINFSPAYCNCSINSQSTTWVNKHFGFNSTGSTIWFKDSDLFTDLETFKTWLETNNAIVYYVLITPTNTKITDATLIAQLENLDNAHSYLDTTIIECSSLIEDNETVRVSATGLERID